MDPRHEIDQARVLLDEGRADDAADALADLWDRMADPAEPWRPMRVSLLARLLSRVAAASPGARRQVERLRDAVAPVHGPRPDDHFAVREWSSLNIALGQADRTLSWLDRVESDSEALEAIRPLAGFIPYVLRQSGRWPDMARWFPDPQNAVRQAYRAAGAWLGRLDDEHRRLAPAIRNFARDRAALVYASLLAAGQDDAAVRAAELAATLDADPAATRRMLVGVAVVDAGQARKHQLAWLGAEFDRSEEALELREKVQAALDAPGPQV